MKSLSIIYGVLAVIYFVIICIYVRKDFTLPFSEYSPKYFLLEVLSLLALSIFWPITFTFGVMWNIYKMNNKGDND